MVLLLPKYGMLGVGVTVSLVRGVSGARLFSNVFCGGVLFNVSVQRKREFHIGFLEK